ncbi:MAG TPA: amidase [Candidatus Elarobacter sp.]|nr:amidase [Candidatus Elarobacter sp.]HEV2737200.1 amidase [Candidatus Elarobacter sp.]
MSDGTVTERARALLERIATVDAQLHCYVAVDGAAVLREAARLDAIEPAARGPLHGRTLAVKDIIDVAGLPTRAGSSFFRRDPQHDAPVVAALRAAGALVIGKTNTHEFAWGITTENPHFGRTANPWDTTRTVGGSSGGSAAAVAAGLADTALGSDTLGSIRIPAALNGISGVRPATGALPLDGIFPLALGLDTVGPFARDLGTVRHVYEILAGAAVPHAAARRACRLRGGAWDRVDADVSSALDEAAAALRANGVVVDDVTWWDDELVRAVGVIQQRAAARVHAPYFAEHAAEYGEDVRARVAHALTLTERDEHDARAAVARARTSWNAATAGYDVALAPSAGAEAPVAPVPKTFRDETIPLVTPASAFGLPVAAVPIGFGPAGLPLGMQIIAVDGAIASAFALGAAYQRLTDWHERRPALARA